MALYNFPTINLEELPEYKGALVDDASSIPQSPGTGISMYQGNYLPTFTGDTQPTTTQSTSTSSKGESKEKARDNDMPGEGFWPIALATLSALSGNFGPAITLTEQRRKTQLEKAVREPIYDINSFISKGEFDKAGEATDNLLSRIGGRSPELTTFLREQRKNILDRQTAYNSFRNVIDYWDEILPEDDIRRTRVAAMKKLLNKPAGVTDKLVGQLIGKMDDPHIQWINNTLKVTDPATLNTKEVAGTTIFEAPKGFVGEQIQSTTGMTVDAITNLMNGKDAEVNGRVVKSTPEIRATLQGEMARLQGIQAQLTTAQNVPMSPEQAIQYGAMGATPTQIATRLVPQGAQQQALGGIQQQAYALAQAGPLAQLQLNPAWASQAGLTVVDTDPGDTFGADRPGMTYNDMVSSGGKYQPIRQKVYDENIKPNLIGLNNLKQITTMFDALGLDDYSSPLDRAVVGINRLFSNYTGITFKPEDSVAKVAEVVSNRALEQLAQTGTISEKQMGVLKKFVTGIGADPRGAKLAVQELRDKMQYELGLYIDKQKVDTQFNLQQGRTSNDQHEQMWQPIAQTWGIEPALVKGILKGESSGDKAISRAGAIGRFQVLPETAAPYLKALGKTEADLFDPTVNAQVGLLYIATLKDNLNRRRIPVTPERIAAMYIGGPSTVRDDGSINTGKQESKLPDGRPGNTVGGYISTVMKEYAKSKPKVNYSATGNDR